VEKAAEATFVQKTHAYKVDQIDGRFTQTEEDPIPTFRMTVGKISAE